MCEQCLRKNREEHIEAVRQAMEHCDAKGVPSDSLFRGLIDVKIACNEQPMIGELFTEMWPSADALMQ
jgi:hypothetical protein